MFYNYQENMDKIFNSVKRSVPRYYQYTTDIQQELLQSFENMVGLSIMIQKEFVKVTSIQNKMMLAIIDATQH